MNGESVMGTDKFTQVDQLIIDQIRAGKKTFQALQAPSVMAAAETLRADAPAWRVVDRRLQALRKRGLIEWNARNGWSIVEASTNT